MTFRPATSFRDPAVAEFAAAARAWLVGAAPAHRMPEGAGEDEEVAVRRAWEAEVHRAGYSCLAWPVAFGGRGLGPIEEFVFGEECARAGAPEGLGRVGRLLAGPALFGHGTPAQRERFLPEIVAGTAIWCQGFSEPDAGSDLAALRTRAVQAGDGYVLHGQKLWTSFGDYADWCLLLARTGDVAARHSGLTMFALPMRQPGVVVRRVRQITGRAEFAELFLDGASAPAGCRIGGEGEGWAVAMTTLTAERGAGFAALALHRIGEDLALLRHCAEPATVEALAVRLGTLRWQVLRALEQQAAGRPSPASSMVLKLTWSELLQDAARAGFTTGCPDHLDRWRLKLLDRREITIASGTSEIQRNLIGERVLGLPR